jgi:hypothetical protein
MHYTSKSKEFNSFHLFPKELTNVHNINTYEGKNQVKYLSQGCKELA